MVLAASVYSKESCLNSDCGMIVGPPTSIDLLKTAFRIVHDRYVEYGYMKPAYSGMRFFVHQLLPINRTVVVMQEGRCVGTGSMVKNSSFGLPSGRLFRDSFLELESQGRVVVEGTLLACLSSSETKAAVFSEKLVRYGIYWCAAWGVDDFCVVINPRHLRFWRDKLGFEVMAVQAECEHVERHPGILVRFDLDNLDACCSDPEHEWILSERITPESFPRPFVPTMQEARELLLEHPQALEGLSLPERTLLEALLNNVPEEFESNYPQSLVCAA